MRHNHKKFFQATAVMLGYIIGVGMFGMPYLMQESGVVSFLFFMAILVPVQFLVHMMYASLILSTREYHRMPGYAGLYIGKKMKNLVFVTKVFGNWGGLLAYIIITGSFMFTLFEPIFGGNEFFYATLVYIIEIVIIFFGIGMIAKVELGMTFLLLFAVTLILLKGGNYINVENLNLMGRGGAFFLPYGAMLMALDGNGALPIVTRLVKRDAKMIRRVILYSTLIVAMLLLVFTFSIAGITGDATTQNALSGLEELLDGVVLVSIIFGVICMITSFIGVAESIKETFSWDYGYGEKTSFLLAVFIPYILYLLGFSDLIEVISFVGAVGGGFSAILMVIIFRKIRNKRGVKKMFKYRPNTLVQGLLICIFVLGIVYSLWDFFSNLQIG